MRGDLIQQPPEQAQLALPIKHMAPCSALLLDKLQQVVGVSRSLAWFILGPAGSRGNWTLGVIA